jgi:hypothetical protein
MSMMTTPNMFITPENIFTMTPSFAPKHLNYAFVSKALLISYMAHKLKMIIMTF